ncbi:hypothetical protein ACFLVX_00820 [Chloroflexota bacterium]
MRMKFLVLAFLLCTTLFAISACSNDEVSLGQELSLQIAESASIKGEELQIRFLEVTEDSRCPMGVTCIWEGRVSCLVEITYQGSLDSVVLTEPGLTSFPPEQSFHEYKLAYHIEPYPQAGAEIAEGEYRLHLKISK